MIRFPRLFVSGLWLVVAFEGLAYGQTAGMLSFQGLLKDGNGDPINGSVNLEFRIYDALSGGNLVDMDGDGVIENVIGQDAKQVPALSIMNGIASTEFGPVSGVAFTGADRWLQVSVNGSALSRVKLTRVPEALAVNSDRTLASVEESDRGGLIRLRNNTGATTITLDGDDSGELGSLIRLSTQEGERIVLDANQNPGGGAIAYFTNSAGLSTVHFWGNDGGDQSGKIRLTNHADNHTVILDANQSGDAGGYFQLTNGSVATVAIDGATVGTGAASMGINNASGVSTISFDGATGTTTTRILTITGGADLAEPFQLTRNGSAVDHAGPGHVVSINAQEMGKLTVSREPYDRRVAGVISGANGLQPGMVMKSEGDPHADGTHNVALTGRVWAWCDASFGVIEPGDRLTTSATPGHAMKVTDNERAIGAVIGKAMTPLAEGRGLVLVLVQPQ